MIGKIFQKPVIISCVSFVIFLFSGCVTPLVYDKTVPEDMMAVISIPNYITVTSYDGIEVNWGTPDFTIFGEQKVYIPAGDHEIFVKYNDRIIPIQDNTDVHLYEFEAGVTYHFRSSGFGPDAIVFILRDTGSDQEGGFGFGNNTGLGSAAATRSFADVDADVNNGGYTEALETLESDKNGFYNDKSVILYELDSGMLNHYAGNYGDSNGHLQEAERLIEEAYTKSLSQREAAGFGGENILDYESEDFEDIYINLFNALNYYHQNRLEEAIVEIRRMNDKLDFFQTKYKASGREERAQVERGGNAEYVSSRFSNSALGRYLGVLFHRANGNQDSVRIDYNWLTSAFNNSPEIYDFSVPSSVKNELAVPAGKARLNFIAFSGLSPIKKAEVMKYPTYENQFIELALPVLESRSSKVSRIAAVFDNGQTIPLEKLENIEAVYRDTYQSKLHNVTLVRTALRASVMRTGKDLTKVDIRSSRFFPALAFVNGINLDPGVYSFTVNYYDAAGQVIHSDVHNNFEVKAGTLNLAEAFCFQ